jgi:hypothetical protein
MVKQIDNSCGTCGKPQTAEVIRNKYVDQPPVTPIARKSPPVTTPTQVDILALQNKLTRYQDMLVRIAEGQTNGRPLNAQTSQSHAIKVLNGTEDKYY